MSRVLILYATAYGQTCAIAERLAQRLREDGLEVELADATTGANHLPPPDDYDAVVIGSRVQFGKHAREVVDYIRHHREALDRLPTGFFSVSMSALAQGPGRDPKGYMMQLFADVGWSPVEAAAFAGALPYRRYGWFLRHVMKAISKREGHPTDTSQDHVFTDYVAVADFADRISDRVIARDAIAL